MGWGRIKGAYLAATMVSIIFRGGLAPAIGILGRGDPGGEGVRIGDIGRELPKGEGDHGKKQRGR
jgi:hypothetical protein